MQPSFRNCLVEDIVAPVRNAIVGGPFGSDLVSRDYVGNGVPVIRGQNMGPHRWVSGDFAFVSQEKADSLSANCARPGDLVFTQRGTLGQVALVPHDSYDRYLISQSQMKLTPDPKKVDAAYLYYVFVSPAQQEYVHRSAIRTGVPHTNLGHLKKTPLLLPDLGNQRAIAGVLSTIDDRIELNQRTSKTLEAMARALFKSWFVDFDPVRAKSEGRAPVGMDAETAKLFPSSFQDLSAASPGPKSWSPRAVYECATYINGAAYRDFDFSADRSGLPIIKIAELKAGITAQTKFTQSNPGERYRIATGDVLFSWSGNPDTSIDTFLWAGGNAWLNQHIFKVVTESRRQRAFVFFLLRWLRPMFADIARDKQTTGLGHVTLQDLKRLVVHVPPDDVLAAFEHQAGPSLDAMLLKALETATLAALRDTLLPKLLSGEVRIKDAEKLASAAL